MCCIATCPAVGYGWAVHPQELLACRLKAKHAAILLCQAAKKITAPRGIGCQPRSTAGGVAADES